MIDKYKHDPEGVATVITSIKEDKEEYKKEVENIKTIIKDIETSNAWKHPQVKEEFINTCNSYLQKYENIVAMMEKLIEYLTNKNEEGSSTENSFAKVGMNE